ncbi:MAG: nucleotidyltransferase domain-containing protein [Endomicrobium sp.]|nr:nucleotidyltransferase domain-containing protein [Endomicrobium sp.]
MNTKRPKEINDYLSLVVERLKAADPYKIVLFGSYAKGEAKPDSDIDLMVILDNEYLSKDGAEETKRDCKVIELVDDIHYKYGMDFKIFSRAEFQELKNRGSFFVYEVERTGETIYEKYN